jgi:hypothetical protein
MCDCREIRLSRSGPGNDAATANCTSANCNTAHYCHSEQTLAAPVFV